jgi:hypothetical protein
MAIWVPEVSREDSTRPPDALNRTANYFTECGALEAAKAEMLL